MKELLQTELGAYMVALPIALFMNILFGFANGAYKRGYDSDKMKLGIVKAIAVLIGVACLVVVTYLIEDGSYLNEVTVIIKGATILYIGMGIKHLAQFLGQKKEVE